MKLLTRHTRSTSQLTNDESLGEKLKRIKFVSSLKLYNTKKLRTNLNTNKFNIFHLVIKLNLVLCIKKEPIKWILFN